VCQEKNGADPQRKPFFRKFLLRKAMTPLTGEGKGEGWRKFVMGREEVLDFPKFGVREKKKEGGGTSIENQKRVRYSF